MAPPAHERPRSEVVAATKLKVAPPARRTVEINPLCDSMFGGGCLHPRSVDVGVTLACTNPPSCVCDECESDADCSGEKRCSTLGPDRCGVALRVCARRGRYKTCPAGTQFVLDSRGRMTCTPIHYVPY
jgi:hypothetical protein